MRLLVICVGLLLSFVLPGQDVKPASTAKPLGDAARGKIVFENNCAECHDAYSQDVLTGPGLKGVKEGKLPDGKAATREKLLDIIITGPAEMPSFKDRISDQEKEDVVAFVLTL